MTKNPEKRILAMAWHVFNRSFCNGDFLQIKNKAVPVKTIATSSLKAKTRF